MTENKLTARSETPTWPDYQLTEYTDYDPNEKVYRKGFTFNCLVRIKGDDGLYYLTMFYDSVRFTVVNEWQSASILNEFIRKKSIEVYRFIMCGKVSPAVNEFNEPMFAIDKSQESEEERLNNLYSFK